MDFCSPLDLFVDHSQLYAWSTSPSGRRELKSLGFKVCLAQRDLGGQVCYTASLRNRVLTDRMASVQPYFGILKRSSLAIHGKKAHIRQVLWPRAFHGCEAVTVGMQHLASLRTGVMRALRWQRAGASPIVRVALLHTEELDPGWQDLWLSIKLFRQQCLSLEIIQDWRGKYIESGTLTHGPFGKLWDLLTGLDLSIDRHFRFWFSNSAWVHFLHAPLTEIKNICLHAFWVSQQSDSLCSRAGFEDLNGFDYTITTFHDRVLSGVDLELQSIVRDGSFFTDSHKSKFDVSKNRLCEERGQKDTREHRYTCCSKYQDVRLQRQEIVQQWPSFPSSFRQFGLVSENRWRVLLWEAFISLPCQITNWSCKPTGWVKNVFTDGSCASPHEHEEALASWAVVWVEGNIALNSSPLKGISQTILRAEISAVLSAVTWTCYREGELHIWCDNQTTVDHFRELQQNLASFTDFEHTDLWSEIDLALKQTVSEVYIHKVASHVPLESCFSPQEDWCQHWNGVVDTQASRANLSRPAWFQQVWDRFHSYREEWKLKVQKLSAFHPAVAHKDIETKLQMHFCEESAVESIEFERFENDLSLSRRLSTLQDVEFVFDPKSANAIYPVCTNLLLLWLIETDQVASSMRLVSYLELFVQFRLHCGNGRTLRQIDGIDDIFAEASFASDFRHCSGDGFVDLSSVNIFMPLPAIYCGWTADCEVQSLSAIRAFVGHRPVFSAQALSKPWMMQ